MQAIRRVWRERERAGRALLNSPVTQDVQIRPGRQEVGLPHGWEVERRPGGLQVWGRRNQNNNNAPEKQTPKTVNRLLPKEGNGQG